MYGSSAFTLVFDSQNSKPSSAVDIRATPERISWGTSEIETKYVFGVQHVVPNAGKCSSGLCKDPSLVQAQALISQAPTGYFMVFGYTITRKNGVFLEPVLRLLKFRQNEFADTPSEMLVIDAVKQLSILVSAANPLAIPKQILFILNPKSGGGNGKSVKIYNEVVSPMLAIAGIEASSELFKTTSPESAVEKIKGLNIANYWCLVALSGDGGFHEIVDALLQRPDWSEASKLAIGTIPAGTSNAISFNIDVPTPEHAMLAILKGNTKRTDAFSVIQNGKISYSHLSVTWAFLADIDLGSEVFRKLGPLRYYIITILRIARQRCNKGIVYILPPENAKKFALKSEDSNPIIGPPRKYTDIESENYRSWPIVLQDNIQLFNASKYSHLDPEFMTNPFAQQDNGLLSICYSHKFLMPVAIDAMLNGAAGDWCANEHVHLQQAVAFVLIPGEFTYGPSPPSSRNPSVTSNYTSSLKGYLSVSGEAVPYAPIKVEVLPGAISLISAPWQQSDRWEAEWRAKHPQK